MMDGGLRVLFRKHLPHFDWITIESGTTGSGIPDSNYCRNGVEGWIEYKGTDGWAISLRPSQVGWIMRRVRHRGRVYIAVRQRRTQGPRTIACDTLWLLPGHAAPLAKEHGLRANIDGMQCWHGGPMKWDWPAIAAALTA